MARLDILRFPDPRLHTVARPVPVVDERIGRLVADMLETMLRLESELERRGCGLGESLGFHESFRGNKLSQ